VRSAGQVLERALPVLEREGAAFKVAASVAAVAALNEGEAGIDQAGKFVTVYPRDDAQAVRLAVALDEATRGLAGPRISTDRPLRPGSLVHYRYGAFTAEREPAPPRVDPFVAAGVAGVEERRPIAGRYVLVSTLHRSAGGSVHLAADARDGRPCVVKRAGRDARVGPDGRDARDHLQHEAAILERLAPDRRVPGVFDLVEQDGDLYLVMEHLAGQALGAIISGPCEIPRTLAWGRALAAALGAIHAVGLIYRDLNPSNVVVGEDGAVRLVDFELATEIGSTVEAAGTPGYASPRQLRGEPASVADDVFALGAVLWFMATGTDPGAPGGAAVADERLERVIARCLDEDPAARYRSMHELDEALAELEAS
jgi:tRNA A-37 threonylcarbamoyl transferase component Bud32